MQMLNFFSEIIRDLALERKIDLLKADEKVAMFFKSKIQFLTELMDQLRLEKKFRGAYEVALFLQR